LEVGQEGIFSLEISILAATIVVLVTTIVGLTSTVGELVEVVVQDVPNSSVGATRLLSTQPL
jgi:hypothetical protein